MDIVKEINKDIREGIKFGKKDSTRFGSLMLKTMSLLIPGIVLGHIIDRITNKLKEEKKFGENILTYIIIQTILSISVFYMLISKVKTYTYEFQNTYSGLYFVSLFFGMQTMYIKNLQEYLYGKK